MAEQRKHVVITEGSATMRYETRGGDTRGKGKKEDDGPVFYNKVQVFNRDLSVMMIALFAQWRFVERSVYRARKGKRGEEAEKAGAAERERLYALSAAELDALLEEDKANDGIRILDALAATGLRSIRYSKEIPGVKSVVANDVDEDAAQAATRNIDENHAGGVCRATCSDAVKHMTEYKAHDAKDARQATSTYDVVDLDPYGTCAPFLDSAVQCVADGGLLCITSTDMTVLSGGYPETCYGRYGSMPSKSKFLHELALRIVLNAVESNANKYGRHIVPVLSLSVDFYVRVFVRVYRRPAQVKRSCERRSFVLQSSGCPSFFLQPVARPVGKSHNPDKFAPALLHRTQEPQKRHDLPPLPAREEEEDVGGGGGGGASSSSPPKGTVAAAAAASEGGAAVAEEAAAEGADDSGAASPPGGEEESGAEHAAAAGAEGDDDEPVAEVAAATVVQNDNDDGNKKDDSSPDSIAPAFCSETGAPFKIVGPFWSAPLHERDWLVAALDRLEAGVDKHLSTTERLHGVLTAVSEELLDVPLYYTLPDLCGTLHCTSPKMAEVKAALAHAGYRCSQFHREPDAVKTDAPPRVLWDIFRCWCKKHPISEKRLAETHSAHAKILGVEPKLRANFATTAAMRAPKSKARRWAPNPEEHWGPKAAAHGRKRPRTHR